MNISTQLATILIMSLSPANKVNGGETNIELVKLINSIYLGIKAQTLAVFDYHTSQQMYKMDDATWNHLEQPKILLTLHGGEELLPKFNSQILGLIIMDNWQWSDMQWQHFQTIIKRWSSTNVIFLTMNLNSTDSERREKFLKQCWQKGVSRMLLTSLEEPKIVYTVNPFPPITIKTTSALLYLKGNGKYVDCHGYPLRVSAGNNPPRALVYYNKTGNIVYRGFIPRLIKIFAQRINSTIEWVLMPNFTKNYALRDCVRYLLTHQIDLCGDQLPLNEKLYVVARPLYISNVRLVVPFAQTIPKYKYFLQPFDRNLWVFIIVTLIYITVALSFMNRLQFGFWDIGEYFLKSLQSFLYLPFEIPRWRGIRKFLAYAILTLGGFIISDLYVTFLSSILTTNVYKSQIETLEELRRRKTPIAINDMDKEVMQLFNSFEQFSDNYIQLDIPTYQRIRNSLDPRFAYINIDDKADFYLHQQKFLQRPLLRKAMRPLAPLYGGMPMQANWPLELLFNQYLLTMFDTGLCTYIEEQTREEGIRIGHTHFLKTTYLDTQPLSVAYFQMPALLLAVGYLIGLLCFVVEKGLHFWKK